MTNDDLQKVFDEDDGLLDSPDKTVAQTEDERLVSSFLEIVDFYEKNGHTPNPATENMYERGLSSRLLGMISNPKKAELLKNIDRYDLLVPPIHPDSLDDILDDDDLGLLDDDTGILNIRNIPKSIEMPEYIGRQKPCKDFYLFEDKFIRCHADISNHKRTLRAFSTEQQIQEGRFFVLNGILVLVAKVGEKFRNKNGDLNARLRLIYENSTESDILLRSFAKGLYDNGKLVTENEDVVVALFEDIEETDEETGFIYILSSMNEDPEIKKIENLYKIGFSSRPVEQRIKNASTDPTYLMAPVKIIATYKCFNMTPQKFEHLLHRFFAEVRLELEIRDRLKARYVPDEWFIVPLDIIDQAIKLVINGEIIHYHYDSNSQKILLNG